MAIILNIMAEQFLETIEKYSDEISEISGDTVVTLPLLGDTTLAKLIAYLPLYIQLTKKKSIRDAIPKELHDAILAFAEASGAYEPPPKKQTLKDLDVPAKEVAKMAAYLEKQGWSPIQIASQMDLPQITIVRLLNDYSRKSFITKGYNRVYSWLQKKVEKKVLQGLDALIQPEVPLLSGVEQENHSKQK